MKLHLISTSNSTPSNLDARLQDLNLDRPSLLSNRYIPDNGKLNTHGRGGFLSAIMPEGPCPEVASGAFCNKARDQHHASSQFDADCDSASKVDVHPHALRAWGDCHVLPVRLTPK